MTPSITVQELKARLDDPHRTLLLLDVRRPGEYEFANLGGKLITLDRLADRLDDLDPYRRHEIVVMCRSGARSGQATRFLRSSGFPGAVNLQGGILAWAREIDPSVPTY